MSSYSYATDDSTVDNVFINVPVSCSLEGTGMNSHNANIVNGTYQADIGSTTLKAYCNDADGFAIYATGYTDDVEGKNVLTNTLLDGNDIVTGTATSGSASNWAVKLQANQSDTYPVKIMNGYDNYHIISNGYDLVVRRFSSTDVGLSAVGSTILTTYQAYVSNTQPAGTYIGQVKYTLVHPNYADSEVLRDAVTVVFDGNGLAFPNSSNTNTVKYAKVCKPGDTVYVGNDYQEVMTSNISTGGIQNGSYTDHEDTLQPITISGADKLKVVVDYALTAGTAGIMVAEGGWDGDLDNLPNNSYEIYSETNNVVGTETYVVNSDTVTFYINSWGSPVSGYDKGVYAKVYPVYNTEHSDTSIEELPSDDCSMVTLSGTYMETDSWKGKWQVAPEQTDNTFSSEWDILNYLENRYTSVKGSTLTLYAYHPYTLVYDGNGASGEFGMGTHRYYGIIQSSMDYYYGWQQEIKLDDSITLLAPNYKRPGFGFIGWSTDQNAANHIGSATIYGPNQTITIDQALLNTANNEHEIVMHAIWIPSAGYLQNWSGCSNMNVGDVIALTDNRDNDTYAVAKLGTNDCWMIENLRLGGDSPMTLTSTDTQSAGVLPAAINVSDWASTPKTIRQITSINTTQPDAIVEDINQKNYAFGNHYSWYVANNLTEKVTTYLDATTSICPNGWGIPSKTNFNNLIDWFRSNNISSVSYPNNFIESGFVTGIHDEGIFENYDRNSSGSLHIGYANGFYWSSTHYATGGVSSYVVGPAVGQLFGETVTAMNPTFYGSSGGTEDGFTVRCLSIVSD